MAATAPPMLSTWAASSRACVSSWPGQVLDVVAPSQRIGGVRDAGLERHDLLRAQGQRGSLRRRERQRLVVRVGMQRLRPAQRRRQRLHRHPDDVVEGLLRRERDAAGLGMEPQPATRLGRAEFVAHACARTCAVPHGTWPLPRRDRCARRRRTRGAAQSARHRCRRRSRAGMYACAFAKVKANSCTAVAPASRMW